MEFDGKYLATDPEAGETALLGIANGNCGFRFGKSGDLNLEGDVCTDIPIRTFAAILWGDREWPEAKRFWIFSSMELLRQKVTNQLPGIWRS